MCPHGSEAHSGLMLNYEVTRTLAHERQHQLTTNAVVARLARRVRRNRRQDGRDGDPGLNGYIVLPATMGTDTSHALAA
jgi:hypothetical protein